MSSVPSHTQLGVCLLLVVLVTGTHSYGASQFSPEVYAEDSDTALKRAGYYAPRQGRGVKYLPPIRRSSYYYSAPRGRKRSAWPAMLTPTNMDVSADEESELNLQKRAYFLRIGRSGNPDSGSDLFDGAGQQQGMDKRAYFLRIGRAAPAGLDINALSPADLALLLRSRDQLLRLLALNNSNNNNGLDESYFAFPRQGRAMSFYFPRMGRAGGESLSAGTTACCPDGTRTVIYGGQRSDSCPQEQSCCEGLSEQSKLLFSNFVITYCTADNKMDKIRQLMTDE